MYEPPIRLGMADMQNQIEGWLEGCIEDACLKVNIEVNRDQLIKALMYDREQYQKGYHDGQYAAEKHAQWELIPDSTGDGYRTYKCSECGRTICTDNISAYPFCHCGAEMLSLEEGRLG